MYWKCQSSLGLWILELRHSDEYRHRDSVEHTHQNEKDGCKGRAIGTQTWLCQILIYWIVRHKSFIKLKGSNLSVYLANLMCFLQASKKSKQSITTIILKLTDFQPDDLTNSSESSKQCQRMEQRLSLKREHFHTTIRKYEKGKILQNRRELIIRQSSSRMSSENFIELSHKFVMELLQNKILTAQSIANLISENLEPIDTNSQVIEELEILQFPSFLMVLLKSTCTPSSIAHILSIIQAICGKLQQYFMPFIEQLSKLLGSPHQNQIMQIFYRLLRSCKNQFTIQQLKKSKIEHFLLNKFNSQHFTPNSKAIQFTRLYIHKLKNLQNQTNPLLANYFGKYVKKAYLSGQNHFVLDFLDCNFSPQNQLDRAVLFRLFSILQDESLNTAISLTYRFSWLTLKQYPIITKIAQKVSRESSGTKAKIQLLRVLTNFLINSDSLDLSFDVFDIMGQIVPVCQSSTEILLESQYLIRYLVEVCPNKIIPRYPSIIGALLTNPFVEDYVHQSLAYAGRCLSCRYIQEIIDGKCEEYD